MTRMRTKATLSPQKQKLVEMMQEVAFGRITDLQVKDGEPFFTPSTKINRKVLFGKERNVKPTRYSENFILKEQVQQLFDTMEQDKTFTINELVIGNGLPLNMSQEADAFLDTWKH